jgi:hypothetical protein
MRNFVILIMPFIMKENLDMGPHIMHLQPYMQLGVYQKQKIPKEEFGEILTQLTSKKTILNSIITPACSAIFTPLISSFKII